MAESEHSQTSIPRSYADHYYKNIIIIIYNPKISLYIYTVLQRIRFFRTFLPLTLRSIEVWLYDQKTQ